MNTLRNLQQKFITAVFEDRSDDQSDDQDNHFDELLVRTKISGKRRLRIYHNNIFTNFTDALSAVYPVIKKLVGDEFFHFMADAYIRKFPSASGNLHDFGARLPEFIEEFEPANSLVYLADVARLEWAYHLVFHAADCQPLIAEKLQLVEQENYFKLIFATNPASQLIYSTYPILTIWQSNQETVADNVESIQLDEGESRLLVIRQQSGIEIHSLANDEFAFLQSIYQRTPFFTACEAATHVNPQCDISVWLLKHIQNQTIVDCEIPAD